MPNDNHKTCAIYTRVSTNRQATEMQTRVLEEYAESRRWTTHQVYEDQGYSGETTKRPAYEDMLEDARKRRFDVLLVWKLDRLSRSLRDLLNTLASLEAWGIDFISYNDRTLDTTTPTDKLVYNVLGLVADYAKSGVMQSVSLAA